MGKKEYVPIVTIDNAPVNKTIDTEISATTGDVVIGKPLPPLKISLPKDYNGDGFLISFNAVAAIGYGPGVDITIALILSGEKPGVYFYKATEEYHVGGAFEAGVSFGPFIFRHDLASLTPEALAGWDNGASGGIGEFGITTVNSYYDGEPCIFDCKSPLLMHAVLIPALSHSKFYFGFTLYASFSTLIPNMSFPFFSK